MGTAQLITSEDPRIELNRIKLTFCGLESHSLSRVHDHDTDALSLTVKAPKVWLNLECRASLI